MQSLDELELSLKPIIGHAVTYRLGYEVVAGEWLGVFVLSYVEDRTEPVFDAGDTEEKLAGTVFVEYRVRACHGDDDRREGK
jgi:hypothetical protein